MAELDLPIRGEADWDVKLNAALSAINGTAEAALALQNSASPVDPNKIRVRDFGAKGDGTTDDSAAIKAAITAAMSVTSNGEVSREVDFGSGIYKITQPDTLVWTPVGGSSAVSGLRLVGNGKRKCQINFSSTATASSDPRLGNLITAGNRLIRLRVKGMRFNSTNANQSWGYFWNSENATGGQVYPDYGTGHNNQDSILEDVEWTGSWKRGIGLDGDWNTNLNSEWVFKNCHHAASTTWADAFLRSGINKATSSGTDPATHPMVGGEGWNQQDQYLNFDFYSCKFEGASGDILKFDKGGSIRIFGGSWIYQDKVGTGTFFNMASETHVNSVMTLAVYGTRFELRSPNNKLIDTGWYSKRGHITFDSCSTSSQSFQTWAAESEQISIRGKGNSFPQVRFVNCDLMGYAKVYAATGLSGGRIVFDQCDFANWSGGGQGTSGAFLRHNGVLPSYRYRDCAGITDAGN